LHHPVLRRENLEAPSTLRQVFEDIRNYLAGMMRGMTRDETLSREVISLLFLKVYDEVNTPLNEEVVFQIRPNETSQELKGRIAKFFNEKVRDKYPKVLGSVKDISLDEQSLTYVISRLQQFSITNAKRDVITEAFEVFIGPALRGGEGQFFTPRNVVRMMTEMLDPAPNELVIDPACGTGGFLTAVLEHIWNKLEVEAREKSWSPEVLAEKKKQAAHIQVRGIDKDSFLAEVARAYLTLLGDEDSNIFCENSLEPPSSWKEETQKKVHLGSFDVVLANPPHGARIQVAGNEILEQYELAKIWRRNKESGGWEKTETVTKKQAPQILFIERCLQLLRPGGRMGVIIPESLLGNPTYGYIPTYLKKAAKILGVVSMPEELFQPYTHNKTCLLFLQKTTEEDYPIFMATTRWCGHDSRGNSVPYDDTPAVSANYAKFKASLPISVHSSLGFIRQLSAIRSNIFLPKYYDPHVEDGLRSLEKTCDLIYVSQLVREGTLAISSGVEVGRLLYGTGNIPFIRTSDISNWELKIDPKHMVDEETYMKYKNKAGVKEHDILMVRDGSYLVGTSCMISKDDTKILFQSHMYRLRVLRPQVLSPFLLFAAINSPIVKKEIESKQFTQNIIDTLGNRIMEIVLPFPRDEKTKQMIIEQTRKIIEERAMLRQIARKITSSWNTNCGLV